MMERLTREQWRRVEELFDAVVDGGMDTLAARSGSGFDPQVRAEVDRLLGLRTRADDFLRAPAGEFAAALLAADAPAGRTDERIPTRIGPYRILREAGRGGMATVYLAERDDPQLRLRVAVKVLREGVIGRSLVRRFLHERQILASLEHPGLARLLDGGISEEGWPWFAMEFVDGVPITRYCDERKLGIAARLELFLRVCEVVQYAHRNLVVHRDLKPSNILVTEPVAGETPGRVKLLDFGIARLLAPEPLPGDGLTRTGLMPMTPEYASPEQVRGEPVSTASDAYQLGVLLYELLAGRRPHQLAGRPLHEVHRILSEALPELPSSVAPHLKRQLRGDLDNILLKALQNSPERRYPSVDRLADDIHRHLAGEPVGARPDTLRYRAGKFVRRHRVGVATAALVFLLLSALASAMTVQAGRIARERDRAEQATTFLVELFEAFEPLEARGATVTVPNILQHGLVRARTELADQPVLRATVLDVIANVYELQGLHAQAEPLLEESLVTRFNALGARHIEVANSRRRLAELRYERGIYGTESLYRAALDTYRRHFGSDHPEVVRTQIGLALLLRARGRYATADSLFRASLAAARKHEELRLDVPIVLSFLGKLRTRAGDYRAAQQLLGESLDLRLTLLGREHPAVANSLDALGELMLARGATDSAEVYFRAALALRARLYDEQHTDIASGLTYLARARIEQSDYGAADSLLARALPIFRRAFGEESPDVAEALEQRGRVALARGDLAAADSLFARALAVWRSKPIVPTHDRLATLLVRTGELRLRQNDPGSARALISDGLSRRMDVLPAEHWQIGEAQSLLGACLSQLGRFQEAEPMLKEGYSRIVAGRGRDDRLAVQAIQRMIRHFDRSGQPAEAAHHRLQQRAELRPAIPPTVGHYPLNEWLSFGLSVPRW
jgi:serine/threonine-protein kinase